MSAHAVGLPAWVTEAYATAEELQREGNERWASSIGPLRDFDGFKVEPGGEEGQVVFSSMLYGGRSVVGSAHEIRVNQRAFVMSRSRRRKAVAS